MPFRVPLAELAQQLRGDDCGWTQLRRYLEHTHGCGSAHVQALCLAMAPANEQIILVLDGLDEAFSRRAAAVGWVGTLSAAAAVILTSRPSAGRGRAIYALIRLGCEGRRIAYLTPWLIGRVSDGWWSQALAMAAEPVLDGGAQRVVLDAFAAGMANMTLSVGDSPAAAKRWRWAVSLAIAPTSAVRR